LNAIDIIVLAVMAAAAVLAASTFAWIGRYLFDHGLADPNDRSPDIRRLYRAYIRHTRHTTGRVGIALWVHGAAAGLFIATGVAYTLLRWIVPSLL
jgi:hypothetical protein